MGWLVSADALIASRTADIAPIVPRAVPVGRSRAAALAFAGTGP
jgi:hypothetical protein